MQNKPAEIWKLDSFNSYYIKTADMTHRNDAEEKDKEPRATNMKSITVKGVCDGIKGEPWAHHIIADQQLVSLQNKLVPVPERFSPL